MVLVSHQLRWFARNVRST